MAVSVSVEDKAVSRYWVSVSPLCPHGSTVKDQSCSGVQPGQMVNIQAFLQQNNNNLWITLPEMSQDIYWLYWITLTHANTLTHISLRAKDLLNNPIWADYRLCLTGKHFHVIQWPFRPKILNFPNMRAFIQINRTFIFRNRSLDWKKSPKLSAPLQGALFDTPQFYTGTLLLQQ